MIAACTGAGLAVAAGGLYAALLTGLVQLNHPSTAKYPVRGIDVSHHQGTIDWPEVKAAGIAFAYLKATEGGDYVDSRFAENRAGARAAGLVVGAYHFFTFCRDGATQARGFIDTVPFDLDGLPPALDIEFGGNCARRPAPAEVEGEVQAWLRMVRAVYRREPVIYVTRELLEAYPGIAEAAPLWVRDVFGSPDWARRPWKLWQYTNRGHVPGISGPVDLDVLQGSDEALARESGVTLGPPPEAVAPPADGDTRPCTDGIREACARLAGIGVEERARDDADGWRVTAEWVRFARRACHLGDGECCGLLGTSALNNLPASQFPHFAWHGRPVVPSQEDSVPSTLELLLRSCELGSVEGCEHAAWSGADDPRLRGFLERSCEGGHAAACHARGHLGANDGPPTDRPWYEKGCRAESVSAESVRRDHDRVACCLALVAPTAKFQPAALREQPVLDLLTALCNSGNARAAPACAHLGRAFETTDATRARDAYARACGGDPNCHRGQGCPACAAAERLGWKNPAHGGDRPEEHRE